MPELINKPTTTNNNQYKKYYSNRKIQAIFIGGCVLSVSCSIMGYHIWQHAQHILAQITSIVLLITPILYIALVLYISLTIYITTKNLHNVIDKLSVNIIPKCYDDTITRHPPPPDRSCTPCFYQDICQNPTKNH